MCRGKDLRFTPAIDRLPKYRTKQLAGCNALLRTMRRPRTLTGSVNRTFEIMMKIMGNKTLGWEGDGFEPRELSTTREWLRSKGNSIEGGTSEIQLNIVAKRILGLPG